MANAKAMSSVQLSLFPCQETRENDAHNGNPSIAKLSTYMKTHEALWRMLASYPGNMPLTEAISRARIDFTKSGAPAPMVCYPRDARKEVAL